MAARRAQAAILLQSLDEFLLTQLGDLGVVVAEDGLEDGFGVLTHARGAAPDLARGLAELRGDAEGGDVGADGLILVGDQSPRDLKCSFSKVSLALLTLEQGTFASSMICSISAAV